MAEVVGIKSLVGRKQTKTVKFMGEDVKISKLSVKEVMHIQDRAREIEKDETKGFEVLKIVIRASVDGAEELDETDFDNFPMDELSKLSNEIMKYSGIGGEAQTPGK